MGVEVAAHRVRAEIVGFAGFLYVQGMTIGIRIDGYRFNAEFGAGPDDPHRDLAPIGYQNFPNHQTLPTGAIRPGAIVMLCLLAFTLKPQF